MKNKELFDRTISVLVKAYHAGTLVHGNPYACAVGNMVAECTGIKIYKDDTDTFIWRNGFFYWFVDGLDNARNGYDPKQEALEQIASTGYTIDQIDQIEKAFEKAVIIEDAKGDPDGYLGLMSVCDTLMQIHQATPQEIETAKALF